ncbi:unnamed protein product [Didymodactylos carnosus]|uniref:Protein translocase subunit SecA n=1 Tax=Didymodactylos carnosus TaxID=1234261 RepID=A0A814HL64_9BILA|nr:unnamed protein product [Didymodactylos carnosus]CAF3782459.1 unnamed protein product [Didymodactylos carnosus]
MFAEEVEIIIANGLWEQRLSLEQIKQLIFKDLLVEESPNLADVKLIETYYIKILLECARVEVERHFDACCQNKDFVTNFIRNSDEFSTITGITRMCEPAYYIVKLESYLSLIDEYDLTSFITNLKAYLWRRILEVANDSFQELEMLQYLTLCFQTNTIPSIVRKTLVEFQEGSAAQSYSGCFLKLLMKKIPTNETAYSQQLQKFLRLVKHLESDYLFLETQFLSLISFYLTPVEITIKDLKNRSIIEIIGGVIYMSEEVPKIEEIIQREGLVKGIDEVRFISLFMFEIDYDLKNSIWHGFNVFVMATKVNVSKECEWNLSGKHSHRWPSADFIRRVILLLEVYSKVQGIHSLDSSQHSREHFTKASRGSSYGEDGQDGQDGHSGESSGNVMILAEQMNNAQNLTVILNGGHGSNGQDAGDGANGKDGIGITMSELKDEYPSPIRFWSLTQDVLTLLNKILSKGKAEICWRKPTGYPPNGYIEVKLSNGQKIIYSLSRYGDFQCYLLYKGSKGEVGGRGGLNGLGGDGGFQGECVVTTKENKPFSVHIVGTKGSRGQNGKSGRTGQYGKNGWDVGYVDYVYWTRIDEFGGGHNQRLTMDYSTNSSSRVYCGYRYDELGSSACYATIKTSVLEHRILTESEEWRETRIEGQRRKEAKATRKNMMSEKAMEKTYSKYFEKADNLMNTVSQMHSETIINFNLMRRKAKQAFEEVESLKERSREKVSRYRIYEVTRKTKTEPKQLVKMDSTIRREQKLGIITNIINSPSDADLWTTIFKDEFSSEELGKLEDHFRIYQTQRKIETTETAKIKFWQKFGLAKFRGIVDDNLLVEINDDINLNNNFNSGKYLKISDKSYEELEWLREFQGAAFQYRNIEDAFHELCQHQLSASNLDMIKTNYDKLASINIGTEKLEELLHLWQKDDNHSFPKLSELKRNKTEWEKVLEVFRSFDENNLNSTELNNKVPCYMEEILNQDHDLVKYLFALFNNFRTLKITNNTLAKMIGWLVAENMNSKNCDPIIVSYMQFEKNFMDKKENSLNSILLAIHSLSHRLPKATWQISHEYPTFLFKKSPNSDSKQIQNIDQGLLEKLYNIYIKKQHEIIDWHTKLNEAILDICLQQMLSNKTIAFAPLLELVAWKNGLQIRVYEKTKFNQLICNREHFVHGKQIVNLLIGDNQTIENLIIDQDDRDELETRLEKLSSDSMEPNSILSSLLHCFTCDGCHLERNEIMIFVNTILECWTDFDIHPDLFSYIILSHSQYHYIDELILIKLENSIRKRLDAKKKLRYLLRKIMNTSVKILIIKKLHESESVITEEAFSNMLTLLPYIRNNTTLLDQLDLSEWSWTLKETYWQHVLSNGRLEFSDENLEQCAFYLVKLENLYGNELVQHLINVIKGATVFSAKTLLIFVHRFYAEDMELCENILDDFGILNSKLSSLSLESNVRYSGQELLQLCRENIALSRNYCQIQDLMTKLGLSESEDRDIDRLVEMITKSHKDDDVFKHLSEIRDLLKQTTNSENLVLKYIVNEINRNNQATTNESILIDENNLRRIVNFIRSNIQEIKSIENCNFYILDIVNRGIRLKRRFSLRDTQKLVVMLMLMNERSLLSQVATGEGKTLIITTFCIIKCLYGEKLDIVTSCSVLAKRDAESDPPKGNKDLYELFGASVGHICSEDIDQRAQTFNRCDVVYGDLSSFQRDYLLDRFYGKNILGTRNFENVIVDEVDSMLLDNGNNMLYLSHDIANMDKLQSLFIFIWRSVNQPVLSLDDLNRVYDNTAIKQSIIADLYGMITRDQVDDDVWQILIKSKTIGEDGRLLMNLKDYTAHIRQLGFQKQKTENRLIFLLNTIADRQQFIKIPSDFYAFVEHHLDKFIDNAKNALFMSEGVDYVIDVDRTGLDPDLNPKIIIIDKNTGTDQSSSQWHEDLHQFLQIKYGCKLSLMSLKAVFISNVSYLKLYQNLYGLSGTLGSRDEKKILNELYNIDLIKIPTSKPKNFFEERPIIAAFKELWAQSIYDETRKKITKHRSVLIICETVKDVDYISKYLVKRAVEDAQQNLNNTIYENLKKPYIYKREHEEFTFGQGNELLSCGKVIIATNLAGRGTDIKLEQKLVEVGGLHVIVTFLPNNCRIEEQGYGRAARCGEHGSGQLIVIGNDEDEHYEELRKLWILDKDLKEIDKLLLDSFLDKWAFWLDEHSQLIETQATDTSNRNVLFKHLKSFLTSITFDFTKWLNSSSQLLKLGNHYAKNKEYDEAEKYYKKIIQKYSYYLPEALYYISFITIKRKTSSLLNKSGQAFQQLTQDLLQANQLLEQRISDCSNDQAIVESFKKKAANSLIHIEAFSEQQKCISQIYHLFINSIEDILGHSVMNNSFINAEINEILALINRKAKINPNEIKNQQSFDKFDSINLSDLTQYKISTEDGIAILEILSRNDDGILEITEGKYRLKANIDCSALPQCYQDAVSAILNSKFAYQLAYQHLEKQYNDIQENQKADISTKLQLRLTSKPYEQLFYDLIDRGIIEDVQVNYAILKRIDLKDVFERPIDTYAKNHQNLSKKENIEFIKKTLEQLRCGIDKYDTPDCFFSSLEYALKMQQNSCVVEASWFSLNGLENLITLEEQRYSWKFWRNFAVVVALGISQIVAGAVLEIFTAGVGTYAASFLINEGISDLFFAAGSLFSGYMRMSGYWEHKKWSMAMSAVTCMIGGVLARGRTVSRIGNKVVGPVRAEGGKKIAQMVGKELIQNVGRKTVIKETMKRIGCKVLEGVAYGAAQGAVDHIVTNYLNDVCEAIQKTITSNLDVIFQKHPLNEVVSDAYMTLGEDQARLLMDQVTRECFEGQSMLQTMYSWCKRIYGAVSRGIGEAMRKIGKADSAKSIQTVLLVLKTLQSVSLIEGVMTELVKVQGSAKKFLDKATKIIQEAIDEKTSATTTRISAPTNVKISCERSTQQWKQVLIQTSNQAIANQIVAPLLSFGANQLISLAGNAIKTKYRSMKEEKYQKQFDSLKKEFDDKTKSEQMDSDEHKKELQTYHDNLMKLLAKTRSQKMFANILRENVPMDMVCAEACAFLVHEYMSEMNITGDGKKFTGIRIVVEGEDGSSHDYSSSSNPSHTTTIALENNHFLVHGDENENVGTAKNNCLHQALVSKYPGLKEAFPDGAAFRQHLSNYVENDKYLRYIISQGWHKFSIIKGSYGGQIDQKKFNQQESYKKLLRTLEDVKKPSKITPEDKQVDDAMKRIHKITENFRTYLNKEVEQDRELRKDLKEIMSNFDSRVDLIFSNDFARVLERFQLRAEQADLYPQNPLVVHPADRVNFAQTDLELESLVGKSVKLSEHTSIIASVIHAEINKEVPEEGRRVNTTAVGIHKKTLYVAVNHIEKSNVQQRYGISDDKCERIRDLLIQKNLLAGRNEIVFLKPDTMLNLRAPHAEMQILSFWKKNGILQDCNVLDSSKPSPIGASKPICVCCSTLMSRQNIHHTIHGKANIPKNWSDPRAMNVRVQQKLSTKS